MDNSDIIIDLLSQIQRGVSQNRNGDSNLVGPLYEQTLKKIEQLKFVHQAKSAKNVHTDLDLSKEADSFRKTLEKALKDAGKSNAEAKAESKTARDEYYKKLKEINEEQKKNLLNFEDRFEKTIDKWEKSLDKQAQKNVNSTLSSGRSDKFDSAGKSIKNFGDSLNRLGGKGGKGVLNKVGGGISKLGGVVSKFSGVLAGLQIAFESLHGYWKQGIEIENKERKYGAQDISAQYNMMSTKLQGITQIKQQDINVAQTTLSAMSSAASSAQSAMGAFAQEAVGIHAQLATTGKKIVYDAYATSHEIASEIPFNIKEGAYKAAEAAVSTASQAQNYNTTDKFSGQSLGIAAAKMSNAISSAYGQAAAQIEGANAVAAINKAAIKETTVRNYESQELQRQAQLTDANYDIERSGDIRAGGLIGGSFVKWWKENFTDISQSAVSSRAHYKADTKSSQNAYLNEITNSIASIQAGNAQMAAQAKATNIQLAASARDMNLSIKKQQVDMKKDIETAANDAAQKIQMAWLKMTEKLNDTFLKHQQASTVMGREMGMTGDKLKGYTAKMSQYQVELSKWGKDLEWMQKFQGTYQETSGRNVEMSQSDFETSAALGLNVGDETVAQYVGGMEIFNHSVEDSNKKLYTMFKEVSKIGLNGKKYAKDLANNLKLAEKFNFKGGVDGLMRMSKWAQNMRFNVASMDGMLDKVQEGGLEGVIKQSAELQVLGGNFAMGSDPLAMAYESYMDPEGYAKRMNGMLAGQGVFDSKTGEVSFGIASQQMMRQYANSTGQDYKDVLNQARAQVKLGQIGNNLSGNFTDDQKMLVANKAQYDTETGKWQVQVGNEKKDVGSLTKEDIEALTPADPTEIQQNMLDELKGLRSVQEQYNGQQKENMAKLEASVWGPLRDSNERIIQSVGDSFNKDFEKYRSEALSNMQIIEQAQGDWLAQFRQGNDEVDKKRTELISAINNLNGTIKSINGKADSHVAGAMSQGVSTLGVSAPHVDTSDLEAEKKKAQTMNKSEVKEPDKSFNWGWIVDGAVAGGLIGTAVEPGIGTAVGAAVGAVGGTAAAAYDYFMPEEWKKIISDTFSYITNILDSYWEGIKTAAKGVWDGITTAFSGVTEGIKTAAKGVWDGIKTTVSGVVEGIKTTFNGVVEGIKTTVSGVWDGIKTTVSGIVEGIKTTFNGVVEGIKTITENVLDGIKAVFTGDLEGIKTAAKGVWDGITTAFSGVTEGIKTAAKGVWDGITTAFSGVTEGIKTAAKGVWDGIKTTVSGVVEGIKTTFNGVVEGIKTTVIGVWDGIKGIIKQTWNPIAKTLKLPTINDGMVNNGTASKINDGLVIQNGKITRIDNKDQILAAKTGGPVDRILDTIHSMSTALPRPMPYDSYVKETPYGGGTNGGKIDIAPIQITINGSIQLNSNNGIVDITQQISNDPNFIRALTQMIAIEVEKKNNGGRVSNILNTNLQTV